MQLSVLVVLLYRHRLHYARWITYFNENGHKIQRTDIRFRPHTEKSTRKMASPLPLSGRLTVTGRAAMLDSDGSGFDCCGSGYVQYFYHFYNKLWLKTFLLIMKNARFFSHIFVCKIMSEIMIILFCCSCSARIMSLYNGAIVPIRSVVVCFNNEFEKHNPAF